MTFRCPKCKQLYYVDNEVVLSAPLTANCLTECCDTQFFVRSMFRLFAKPRPKITALVVVEVDHSFIQVEDTDVQFKYLQNWRPIRGSARQ